MKFNIIFFSLFLVFSSCNLEQNKIEKELSSKIQFFSENKKEFNDFINDLEKQKLLLGPDKFALLEKTKLSKKLLSQTLSLKIKEIKYGRFMPCDAMREDLREVFLHTNDTIAFWYCPCMNLTEKNHYHKNSELRGYKGLIDFNSIGLGGNWAIVKIKN